MEFPLKPKGSTMGFAVEASRSGSRPCGLHSRYWAIPILTDASHKSPHSWNRSLS